MQTYMSKSPRSMQLNKATEGYSINKVSRGCPTSQKKLRVVGKFGNSLGGWYENFYPLDYVRGWSGKKINFPVEF